MRRHDQALMELSDNSRLFEQIVTSYPEPAISHRPSEHQWSIKENLCHLVDIQEICAGRIFKMMAEENPTIELYDEERENRERDHSNDEIEAYKAAFVSTRERLVAALRGADASAWERTGRHAENPNFTIEFVVNDMLDHEHKHFEQVRLITTRM